MKIKLRQVLSVCLVVLMVSPPSMPAANSAAVLGSISSYGEVKIGGQAATSQNTLFAGDLVKTSSGSAIVQYKQGARVALDKESAARFETAGVELQQGVMSFRAASLDGPLFSAAGLRLEPAQADSIANVRVEPGKAAITVTQGSVRAVDPTGATLSEIKAGETRLFAMAAPAAVPPPAAASAAAPPLGAPGTVWLLVLSGVAAGVTTSVLIVSNNNAADNARAVSPSAP